MNIPSKNSKRKIIALVSVLLALLTIPMLSAVGRPNHRATVSDEDTVKLVGAEAGNNSQKSVDNTSQEQSVPSSRLLKVPELSIEIALPKGLEELEYNMQDTSYKDSSGNHVDRFSPAFTTRDLMNADARCAHGSLGVILKITSGSATSPSDPVIKLGGNKFVLNRPQSPCTDNMGVAKLQLTQTNLFVDSFSSAKNITETTGAN